MQRFFFMLICGLLSTSVMASNDMLLVDDLSEEHLEAQVLVRPLAVEIQDFIQEARGRIMISLAPWHVADFPNLRAGPNSYVDVYDTLKSHQKQQKGAPEYLAFVSKKIEKYREYQRKLEGDGLSEEKKQALLEKQELCYTCFDLDSFDELCQQKQICIQEDKQASVRIQLLGSVCREIEGEISQIVRFSSILDHLKEKQSPLCKNKERLRQAFMLIYPITD